MTKKAIAKLPDHARVFCESRQKIISACNYYEPDPTHRAEQTKAELRGYLACLLHSGAITQTDFRCLYLFYGTL